MWPKGAAHASRSGLCFALVWMLAKNVTVATSLRICSFTGLRTSVCYVRSNCSLCGHEGSLHTICVLLACKQRVGDAISVKTLVRLPDLFRRPWTELAWESRLYIGMNGLVCLSCTVCRPVARIFLKGGYMGVRCLCTHA